MWSWTKYLLLAVRLATLFENLLSTKANAKDTTAESYSPAAAALLADPKVKRWTDKRTAEEQTTFATDLPLFVWALDAMTE